MSDAGDTPPKQPRLESSHARLTNAFIVAFLLFQIGMPLRYYFGNRGYDERFSWRMFSTLRMQQCEMQISEATERGSNGEPAFRDVQVKRDVQAAWVNLLERVRMPVVEKYLKRRCEQQGAVSVRYTRRCQDTDGSALPVQKLLMECSSGELREAPP
jgi:hypothetical protein